MKHARGMGRLVVMVGLLLGTFVGATRANGGVPTVNVTGKWVLMVTDTTHMCSWKGPMVLSQTGMDFVGSATLQLVSGVGCPNMFMSDIEGMVSGGGSGFFIEFGFATGPLGEVLFRGTVAEDGQSAMGEWEDDAEGTWSALKLPAQGVPALSGVALGVLMTLLAGAGVVLVHRRGA